MKVRKATVRKWPITVMLMEGDDAGNVVEIKQTFVGHFKPLSEKQYKEIDVLAEAAFPKNKPLPEIEIIGQAPQPVEPPHGNDYQLARNAFIFCQVLCGWGPEVTEENGQPLAFSEAALTDLITGPDGMAVSAALNLALMQLRYGLAPEKNSKNSPVPGDGSGELVSATATSPTSGETLSPTT